MPTTNEFKVRKALPQAQSVPHDRCGPITQLKNAYALVNSDEFWNRWYMRYLAAMACFGGSLFFLLMDTGPRKMNSWVSAIGAAWLFVVGIWKAREVTLPLLAIGAVCWWFSLIVPKTPSVPAAIVFGALIIAIAINGKR
jgi:hypothetical protein